VITEAKYTQIIYNDKNETTETFFYVSNEKLTGWLDEECSYFKSEMLNETRMNFLQANCFNGTFSYYYGPPTEDLPDGVSALEFT
jgi:hypothetical protein